VISALMTISDHLGEWISAAADLGNAVKFHSSLILTGTSSPGSFLSRFSIEGN
jgi:hypothetical protein